MFAKKTALLLLIIIFLNLGIFIHPLYLLPILLFLHILFNETDFFYRENSIYEDTDPTRLFRPEAGPIEIRNYTDKAIIFVHGFPSTPYNYNFVAPLAAEAGYDVFAPLLPGFGTNHEDFRKSNFTQWFVYLCGYYLEVRRGYKKVYVVGLSMGGTLTLKLAEKYLGTWLAPDGISVNAAPVFLNFLRKGVVQNWLLYGIRTISWFIKYLPPKNDDWKQMDDGHAEWIGYEGQFPPQIFSLKIALESVRAELKKITVPVIAFQIREDKTVPYGNLAYIEKHISSEVKSFNTLEYKGHNNTAHSLFLYESIREKLLSDIITFFEKECP